MGWAAVDSPRAPKGALFGREDDIDAVARALDASRLITLTGAPGIGKTRLALAIAAAQAEPAVVVELASVADPLLIPGALSSALSVQEGPGRNLADTIVATLRRRRLLLVVDNCEHLLQGCAEILQRLLLGCPDVRVLATSRVALGLAGELTWPVPPLAVPEPESDSEPAALLGYPAIALFLERAASAQPGFAASAFLDDVADVCRRLEGIPLAIELAAARVGTMTPHEIARRLEAHLGLLSDRAVGGVPRHRTLETALEWSYALLSAGEQTVLRCLSAFADSFDLEAAAVICCEAGSREGVSELLDRLVSRSLLVTNTDRNHSARYRMLATVRAYAAEQLERTGTAAGARTAHARFYTGLAERAELEFTGPSQLDWFGRISSERANMRAAAEWALGCGDRESALRLAGALVLFWRVRGPYSEGRELLQAALSVKDSKPDLRAKALWGAGFLTLMVGDARSAVPLLEESLDGYRALDHKQGCARALLLLADAGQYFEDEPPFAVLMESADLAREAGDEWCLAHALGLAGFMSLSWREDLREARTMFEECLVVAREAGDMQGLRFGLIGLGRCCVEQGDYKLAESLLTEAVEVTLALGESYDQAEALTSLGALAQGRGDYAQSSTLARRALSVLPEAAPPASRLRALLLLATVAQAQGDARQARTLLDDVSSQEGRTASVLLVFGRLALMEQDPSAARQLFEEALALARPEAGKGTRAATMYELALLCGRNGELHRAASLLKEALTLQHELRLAPALARTLEAVADLAVAAGHLEHAARAADAAQALRDEREHDPAAPLQLDNAAIAGAFDCLQPERATRRWGGLTERELEIAALVAGGLSNREIAEHLVIARETVWTHLSHIYAKIDIRGRAALADEFSATATQLPSPPVPSAESKARLASEADAYGFLETLRWPRGEPVCPHCGSTRKHYFLMPKGGGGRKTRAGSLSERRLWKCASCRRPFSVLTGTVLHGSKVPVQTWVDVVRELACSDAGVSAHEIEREYGLTPKTASLMIQRIREALRREPLASLVSGQVTTEDSRARL